MSRAELSLTEPIPLQAGNYNTSKMDKGINVSTEMDCCCFSTNNYVPWVAQRNISIVAHTQVRQEAPVAQ